MRWFTYVLLYFFVASKLISQEVNEGNILVLIDSDMAATTYSDGQLLPLEGHRDQLIKIDVSSNRRSVLNIPNSVTGWTKSMDITPDKNYVIITAIRGSRPQGSTEVSSVFDLPPLQNVYMVDLTTLEVLDEIKVGNIPSSVSVNPKYNLIGTTVDEMKKEIGFINYQPKKFITVAKFPHNVPRLGKNRATDISWHPSGDYFAITLEENGVVGFSEIMTEENNLEISDFTTVAIGKLPGAGTWSHSGDFYIVPDINNWVGNGMIYIIAPNVRSGKHRITAKAMVGRAPEAVAISDDDRYVVVSCMEGTFFPTDHSYYTEYSTLILFGLGKMGELVELDRVQSDEILPQSIAFRPQTYQFALTSFQSNKENQDGFISLWAVRNEKLVKLDKKIEVPRGAHTILWIP